jgi:hypothetical protein
MPNLFKASLLLASTLQLFNASSQHLFGNPSCLDWQKLSIVEKTTWLNAYLVPLNLTNMSRQKPRVDKFSQLKSLDPAILYVDSFCAGNAVDFAAVGALRFLDELTGESKSH